jgi:hypothetical protein
MCSPDNLSSSMQAMLDVFTARGDLVKHASVLTDVHAREKNIEAARRAAVSDSEADDATILVWKLL